MRSQRHSSRLCLHPRLKRCCARKLQRPHCLHRRYHQRLQHRTSDHSSGPYHRLGHLPKRLPTQPIHERLRSCQQLDHCLGRWQHRTKSCVVWTKLSYNSFRALNYVVANLSTSAGGYRANISIRHQIIYVGASNKFVSFRILTQVQLHGR